MSALHDPFCICEVNGVIEEQVYQLNGYFRGPGEMGQVCLFFSG